MNEQKPKVTFAANVAVEGVALFDGGPAGPYHSEKYGNDFFVLTLQVAGTETIAFCTPTLSARLQTICAGDKVWICKVEKERDDGTGLYRGWDVYINGIEAPITELSMPMAPTPSQQPLTPQGAVQAVTAPSRAPAMMFSELEGLVGHCLNTSKQMWTMIMDEENSDAIERLAVHMSIACLDKNISMGEPEKQEAPQPPKPPGPPGPPKPPAVTQPDDEDLPF